MESGINKKLPIAVCAVVNDILAQIGTHKILDETFKFACAPGDPPALSHKDKWKIWLRRASEDPSIDAHQVLGKVIEEFMEVRPRKINPVDEFISGKKSEHTKWVIKKKRLEKILDNYGLQYVKGGRIIETGVGIASEAMEEALKAYDLETVEIEFRRAIQTVLDDPEASLTADCALLEALFKAYLEDNGRELPSKQTIKPLWKAVQKELGLNPKDQTDTDIQRILSGLSSIVDGIGALRTHAGSAHGRSRLRYRVQPRHARLLLNSAHTLAVFLIETWSSKDLAKHSKR